MGAERWISILAGLGLTLWATRRHGGAVSRLIGSTVGMSLLSRGATGYCGMKAAMHGDTSIGQGLMEQYQRVRGMVGRGAASIDNLESLYIAELQELHSAEAQLSDLVYDLSQVVAYPELEHHLRGYAAESRSRREDLGRILGSYGRDPRQHPDQAMQSLINETKKMAQVCGANIRDAALVASLQRILHYKIAAFGTVASYAKTLGHIDEASRFAEYADRDEAVDAELTTLAKNTLNPQASEHPQGRPGTSYETRPH
jgi:ferritin-like metal-binding protein YciE